MPFLHPSKATRRMQSDLDKNIRPELARLIEQHPAIAKEFRSIYRFIAKKSFSEIQKRYRLKFIERHFNSEYEVWIVYSCRPKSKKIPNLEIHVLIYTQVDMMLFAHIRKPVV